MSNFERVFTESPWERKIGYCRILKAGNHVYVTGTAAVDKRGQTVAPGDPYQQAKKCLEIIKDSLGKIDVPFSSIVRTRMFVTDISKWEDYGRAHAEAFKEHPPATSMLEVKGLIDTQMLIEIEADAYVGQL